MVPHITRYTDDLPAHAGGTASYFVIRIRPKYKGDKGLHEHELLHVAQWWVTTILSALLIAGVVWYTKQPVDYYWLLLVAPMVYKLLYGYIYPFAIWCEVQCYRKQLQFTDPKHIPTFAKFMATKYHFDISQERAEKLLRS
jgi:hypothetical protein